MCILSKSYIKENGITTEFLLALKFEKMSETEKFGYLGCESETPMIAYTDELTVVLDDSYVEVYDLETCEVLDSGVIAPSELDVSILTA
jgi:hypothetical protein